MIKYKLLVDWLMIQWMNLMGYKFQFDVFYLSLNVWSGSSMKIDETWSMVVLMVESFSEGVVAPFQW